MTQVIQAKIFALSSCHSFLTPFPLPFGDEQWVVRTAAALGLEHTLRDAGRPRRTEVVSENQ